MRVKNSLTLEPTLHIVHVCPYKQKRTLKMTKSAYTINEAVNEIGIGRTKLYAEIKDGKIQIRKIGRKSIILADELLKYLNSLPSSEEAQRNTNSKVS